MNFNYLCIVFLQTGLVIFKVICLKIDFENQLFALLICEIDLIDWEKTHEI